MVENVGGVIGRLTQELTKLPGIGPKSAERIAHFLLAGDHKDALLLSQALAAVAELEPRFAGQGKRKAQPVTG